MTFAMLIIGLFLAAMAVQQFNASYIPTPPDLTLRLESSITKAVDYAGTAFDFGDGYAPGGNGTPYVAVVNVTAVDVADLDETYSFTLTESDDGITYTACGAPSATVTAVGAFSVGGIVSKRYVKLALDLDGTTPSITYESWLHPIGR